jgi:ATP phosphoribosyltransferase regulatory subunit
LTLALDAFKQTQIGSIACRHGRCPHRAALLEGLILILANQLAGIHAALAAKDASELARHLHDAPTATAQALLALLQLYGDETVLQEAQHVLPQSPAINTALAHLKWLSSHVEGASLSFDLADMRGYAYYSGAMFSMYAPGASDALARGGRYDEVGQVFGRKRPAVGFSLDIKALSGVAANRPLRAAIRAPWGEAPSCAQP